MRADQKAIYNLTSLIGGQVRREGEALVQLTQIKGTEQKRDKTQKYLMGGEKIPERKSSAQVAAQMLPSVRSYTLRIQSMNSAGLL